MFHACRSQRILWLLEELQIPYEIKHYARDPKVQQLDSACGGLGKPSECHIWERCQGLLHAHRQTCLLQGLSPADDRLFMAVQTMVAPKELKAVHPLGKSPVITDGDLTVAESGKRVARSNMKHASLPFMLALGAIATAGCHSLLPSKLVQRKQLPRCLTACMGNH